MPQIEDDERYSRAGAVPPLKFKDADTVDLPGTKGLRIQGINAPETGKLKHGIYTPGQIGGERTTANVQFIADQGGYNKPVLSGKKDAYKRELGDMVNAEGQSLSKYLTDTGVVPISKDTGDAQVRSRMNSQAALELLPDMATKSPGAVAAKIIQDANFRDSVDQGYLKADGPRALAKTSALNEVDYAQHLALTSHKTRAEIGENIEYLQGKLAKAKTDDEKERIRGELAFEQLGLQRSTLMADTAGGPMTRLGNRTIDNKSINQLTDSWDTGMLNIRKGFSGIGAMAGDKTGWEWLKNEADAQNFREGLEEKQAAKTLSSYKEVNSVGNAVTYVGNLLASSAPQMLMQIGGNALTGGLGTVLAGAVYAGEAYNGQPADNKNATLALGTGIFASLVDQLGVEKLMGGKFVGNAAKKADLDKLAQSAVETGKYATKAEAMNAIESMAQKEIVSAASAAKEVVHLQMKSKDNVMKIIKGIGSSAGVGGSEAIGEILQESLTAWGKTGNINPLQAAKDMSYLDWKQLEDNLMEAAAGGFFAGGTIGGAAKIKSGLDRAIRDNLKEDYAKDLSETVQYNEQNRQRVKDGEHTGFIDVADAAQKFSELDKTGHIVQNPMAQSFNLNELEQAGAGSVSARVKEVMKDPWSVFRGAAATAIKSPTKKDGTPRTVLPAILSMISGSGHLQGAHYSRDIREMQGSWQGQSIDQLAAVMKTDKGTAEGMVKQAIDTYKKTGEMPKGPEYDNVALFLDQQDQIRQDMQAKARAAGIPAPHLDSFSSMIQGVGRMDKVIKNRSVINQTYASADPAFRNKLATALNNLQSSDKGKSSAARTWLNQEGVTTNPELSEFFDPNPMEALASAKQDLAYNLAQKKYWGDNGETVGKALVYAWNRGEFDSKEEFYETAHMINKMRKISTGEFHSMDDAPKWLKDAYAWGTTLTLLNVLTKTAITSQIETVMSTLGHHGPALEKQMSTYMKELKGGFLTDINAATSGLGFKTMARQIRTVANADTLYTLNEIQNKRFSDYTTPDEAKALDEEIKALYRENFNHDILEHLGYTQHRDTANRFETPSGFNHSGLVQGFVRAIQLKNVTEAQRLGVIAGVPDVFMDHFSTLLEIPNLEEAISKKKLTNEQAQAINQMSDVGMDVHGMLSYLKSTQDTSPEAFQDFMRGDDPALEALRKSTLSAIGNYVDKHIVEPDFSNSPAYYHSPWLRPLTTLKKFTATANAVIIPRLYHEYLKEGNWQMKYDAFQTMMMALVMAHLTNSVKDWVTWGDDEEGEMKKRDKKSGDKKYLRDLYSSGLLGPLNTLPYLSAQSVVDPFRDKSSHSEVLGKLKSGDIFGAAGEIAKEVSPVASWAAQPVDALSLVAEGKIEKAAKKAADALPYVGGFKGATHGSVHDLAKYFSK